METTTVELVGDRRARAVGRFDPASALLAGGVFVAYMVGAGRSYGYDASVTIDQFIRGGDPIHALSHSYSFNNHVSLSVLESLVWRFGGHSEVAQRVLPVLFAAVCVYVVAAWVGRRSGTAVGLVSGLLVAFTPIAAAQGREVRGYSLATVCVTGAALLVVAEVQSRCDDDLRLGATARSVAVASLLGVAIGSHLFVGLAIVGLAAWVAVADRTQLSRWRNPVLAGVLLGLVIHLPTLAYTVAAEREGQAGRLQPTFPWRLGRELLGRNLIAVALLGAVFVAAVMSRRDWRRVTPGVAAAVAMAVPIVVLWLVVHPSQLFPRFFVWLVPGVAIAVGSVLHGRPRMVALAGIAIVLMAVSQIGNWTTDPLPNRQIAATVTRMHVDGPVCSAGQTGEAYMAYLSVVGVFDPASARTCAVLVGPTSLEHDPVAEAAAAAMPYRREFTDAVEPGFLFSTQPIPSG